MSLDWSFFSKIRASILSSFLNATLTCQWNTALSWFTKGGAQLSIRNFGCMQAIGFALLLPPGWQAFSLCVTTHPKSRTTFFCAD